MIELFDLTHIIRTIEKQKSEKTTQIDLSTYPSGIYFIKISSKDKFYIEVCYKSLWHSEHAFSFQSFPISMGCLNSRLSFILTDFISYEGP